MDDLLESFDESDMDYVKAESLWALINSNEAPQPSKNLSIRYTKILPRYP